MGFGHAETQQWSDVVTCLLDEFPQLDHMLRPGSVSASSQLPVFVLGGKGILHHPLWFEEPSNNILDDERTSGLSDDSDEEDQGNEFFNTVVPTLPPIEVSTQPDLASLDSIASTVEENEDGVRTLQTSGLVGDDWEFVVQGEEERVVDEAETPVAGNTIEELKLQLSEAASESVPPAAATGSRKSGLGKLFFDV